MLNRPSTAVNKRAVMLVGAVLAMIAMLVISSPAPNGIFAHPHGDNNLDDMRHIHYAENGTRVVRDFDSTDPEEDKIEWNVRGVDAADFAISSAGVLTFIESPDYENPTDRARIAVDLNNNGVMTDPGEAEFDAGDNDYQITVSATEMSDALPAKRTDIALTVTVENANDPGTVTLQWLQPEVGTPIMATLTDSDGTINSTGFVTVGGTQVELGWTWYTSKISPVGGRLDVTDESHWNAVTDDDGVASITSEDAVSSYTPQGDNVDDAAATDIAVDEGKHLRVKVVYTDLQNSDAPRTVYGISRNPVRAEVSSPGDNGSPDFGVDADTRTVPESTAVGDRVGDPVAAIDPDGDTLTYELVEVGAPNDGDDEFFDIDQASGQITVAQELDYDAVGDRTASATAGDYKVIVRATDPSGLIDNITVTITAENVNEDPVVTGRAELSVVEGTDGVYTTLQDAPAIGESPDPTGQQNEYVYEEPDQLDSIARWTLEGDDAGAFDHSGRFEPRYLQFKVAPDYENPTDMNRDNVYEVTLVATDTDPLGTGAGIGKVKVWLTVTNVNEKGKVVFTEGETAYLDEMLVAEVQDPDDHGGDMGRPYQGVHIVSWQWSSAKTDAAGTIFVDIVGATTNRYTAKDSDRGYYLRATATYTDPLSDPDNPETPEDERISMEGETPSLRTEMATTENAVSIPFGPESVPTFDEAGTVTREVAENTGPGGSVGDPVAAMGESLAYTLEGSDAKYFNIDQMGQITVGGDDMDTVDDVEPGTDPELDYEKKKRFSVTVKVEVTGGEANQNAQVDVNIIVTDVDEIPKITDEDVDAAPMTTIMYPEIDEDGAPNTEAVATYVGTDSEGDTISWDLRGADAALFTIPGGVLQFVAAPDYEKPKDVAGANTATPQATASDNTYDIVIRAIASRVSGDTSPAETVDTLVAVTVTDVDEKGEVVISLLQPEAGTPIEASLTDPDGGVVGVGWQWAVSKVSASDLKIDGEGHWGDVPGGTLQSYTPANSDATPIPRYLRVTASYTDENGTDKMARMMSANPVQALGGGRENGSPDFVADKVDRSVAETADVGDKVGAPVTASVESLNLKDTLTYRLRAFDATDVGTTGVDAPSNPAADVAAFDIDKASGQITVADKLDYEGRGDPDDGIYVVVATVTDPSGLNDSIVVVITAEDRNEDPVLSGRPELMINEIDGGEENAANPDFFGNSPAPAAPTVNVYEVVDEDHRSATDQWALKGEDAGQFQLIGTVGRTLVFRNQPDYENPADTNGDNVYKVTVVTFDGDGGSGEFDVCIAVMNINEEGKITLRDKDGNELDQPHALGPITADLTDPDGGVTGITWEWDRSQLNSPFTDDTDITDPMSATYTPTNADTGFFLRVTATYMDAKNDMTTDPPDTETRTAVATAAYAVLEKEDLKRTPEFPEETAMRMVAENAPSTTFVGDHLPLAVDLDDPKGLDLKYELEGEDTEFFELLSTDPGVDGNPYTADDVYSTQIRVKLHDEAHDLDHEAEGRNGRYEVVLKVTDDSGLEDTIAVTITVMDRNEAPSTPMEASDEAPTTPANNAPEFAAVADTREVPENTAAGENIGAPVMATDDDAGDTLTYTLGGIDMASFDIDGATGQLMTKAVLDFDTKASYTVEVMADDGNGGTATITVTITVTEVPEGSALDLYDADNSGEIEGPEVIQAVRDYFADTITGLQVIEVVKLYFAGRSN